MIRLVEFNNGGNPANKTSSSTKSVADLIKSANFKAEDGSTDNQGLAIAPNGMVAVQYDNGAILIRPENDLELDAQTLAKFEQDLTNAKKLAGEISRISK